MKVGDLIRYKKYTGDKKDDDIVGIVIYAEDDGYTVEVEWSDGERHVYFPEHQRYLEVIPCK
jgi:hypothetical protein